MNELSKMKYRKGKIKNGNATSNVTRKNRQMSIKVAQK